ncbi:hypothetical protein NHQ30_000127 [Ciborinia camelliae]|nr:hypothetical protein NHQ30_000127 [Ciborinia camelliae]
MAQNLLNNAALLIVAWEEQPLSDLTQLSKINSTLQNQLNSPKSTQLFKYFEASTASLSNFERPYQFHTSLRQLPTDKMGGITVVNNSTADIYVSVTYDGNDFQKGGSESWYTVKANGGKDSWGYRDSNQIVRVARSQTPGTAVESYLAVPDKTLSIN